MSDGGKQKAQSRKLKAHRRSSLLHVSFSKLLFSITKHQRVQHSSLLILNRGQNLGMYAEHPGFVLYALGFRLSALGF